MSNWKTESRAWPQSLDATLGDPGELCVCGHTRDHHGMVLGVNGRGRCNECENHPACCGHCGHSLAECDTFTARTSGKDDKGEK